MRPSGAIPGLIHQHRVNFVRLHHATHVGNVIANSRRVFRFPPQFAGDENKSRYLFRLWSAFKIASVIAMVPTLVMPGCMMSPVR